MRRAFRVGGSVPEEGKALVELALLAPVLIIFALGSMEVFRSFHNFQYMSLVAREIGNAVYRDCSLLPDDAPPASTQTSDCVAPVVARVNNYLDNAGGVLPGRVIIVKVYRVTGGAPVLAGGFNVTGSGGYTSQYDDAAVQNLNSYDAALRGSLVTTEVWFQADPLTDRFTGVFYETSIY